MAQKTFSCSNCASPIEVPDDYKDAVIPCPMCGIAHSRHSEKRYISPRETRLGVVQPGMPPACPAPINGVPSGYPAPSGSASAYGVPLAPAGNAPPAMAGAPPLPKGAPYPQVPMPVPYPGVPFQRPLPARNNTPLIVGLCLAGFLLLAIAVAAGMIFTARSSSLGPQGPANIGETAGPGGSAMPESWVPFESKDGGFKASFPMMPSVETKSANLEVGRREIYNTECHAAGVLFHVVYFDLGMQHPSQYQIDVPAMLRGISSRASVHVQSEREVSIQGVPGTEIRYVRMGAHDGMATGLRVGNRVFLVVCDGKESNGALHFERFIRSFSFDENLLYTEPVYFELTKLVEQQERSRVFLRMTASGGKRPYSWHVKGLPKGLESRPRMDSEMFEISGLLEESGTFSASVTLLDARKVEFKRDLNFLIAKAPQVAGGIEAMPFKGRAGLPVAHRVLFKPSQAARDVTWSYDEKLLPRGVELRQNFPGLDLAGVPAQDGRFEVTLTCSVTFEGLDLTLSAQATLVIELLPAWPDVSARFGRSTLIALRSGPYDAACWKFLLGELGKRVANLRADEKLNLWTLSGYGRVCLSKDTGPQPASEAASIRQLLARDSEKSNLRAGSLAQDLEGIAAEDFAGYERLLLVTMLRAEDTQGDEWEKLKAQLLRLKQVPGLGAELVIVANEIPKAMSEWLGEHKLAWLHFAP